MFSFTAKADDGETFSFESDSRDVANWERTTKGAAMGQLAADDGAGMSFTALYRIAWFAARRLGLVPRDMSQPDFERRYALELEDRDKADESDEGGAEDDVEGSGEGDDPEGLSEPL